MYNGDRTCFICGCDDLEDTEFEGNNKYCIVCDVAYFKPYEEKKNKRDKYQRQYYQDNKGKSNAYHVKRYATKIQSTPPWFEKDLVDIVYEKAQELGELWDMTIHVDHVVPLQGKNVCVLHCFDNLQLMEESLNKSKSNKWT